MVWDLGRGDLVDSVSLSTKHTLLMLPEESDREQMLRSLSESIHITLTAFKDSDCHWVAVAQYVPRSLCLLSAVF